MERVIEPILRETVIAWFVWCVSTRDCYGKGFLGMGSGIIG